MLTDFQTLFTGGPVVNLQQTFVLIFHHALNMSLHYLVKYECQKNGVNLKYVLFKKWVSPKKSTSFWNSVPTLDLENFDMASRSCCQRNSSTPVDVTESLLTTLTTFAEMVDATHSTRTRFTTHVRRP